MAVIIKQVEEGSPAQAAGLRGGMELVAIDGNPINDGLDYEFYSSGAALDVTVRDSGTEKHVAVRKEEYQPLGCEFDSYLITPQHHCKNKCVFCFIDQLPGGLRAPLYFKDDDERLGFLFGNYITLTNLADSDVERIIKMRFSPVNISVHTVDPALRVRMMGNPRAGEALGIIPRLVGAGISLNFQLVLVPGMNDGPQLQKSIDWLAALGDSVQSIAAVPVGLTKHRQNLPELRAYTPGEAARQLDIMLAAGDGLLAQRGSRTVYPSDEWFLLAGRDIPGEDFYEGYPQLENGVGMWRLLRDEFTEALEDWKGLDARGGREPVAAGELGQGAKGSPPEGGRTAPGRMRHGSAETAAGEADIVVGTLAAPLFRELAALLEAALPGAKLHVHAVRNDFFGPGVTVTGLLTGQDIIAQLKGKLKTGRLLLPADTLRAEGDIMLDGATPAGLAEALGVRVQVAPKGGDALLRLLLESE